jgi:phosphoribosylglycinamide formyltransferase 1
MLRRKVVFIMKQSKKRVAVFASGNGSNLQAIIDSENEACPYTVELVVCDNPEAFAIVRAEKAKKNTFVFQPKQYANKEMFEREILQVLREYDIDLLVLAGYMRLIGPTLLSPYKGKIINIHPSLLPAFPGKDAIGQALLKKVKVSGVTIHEVDEGMDTGPIIAQEAVNVSEEDTRESLQQKINQVERQLYPQVLATLCLHNEKRGQRQWQ